MTLVDLTMVIDCEQQMVVCVQNHAGTEVSRISGDQASICDMLSDKILESNVECVSARGENTIWIWVEEGSNETN